MYSVRFVWREDQDYGGEGWAPKKFPEFNIVQGVGLAHDALEHFADDDGSLHGELQAFGAMIHVRWLGGWHYMIGNPGIYTPAVNMANDFIQFMYTILSGEELKAAPKTYRCRGVYGKDVEKIIDETLIEARKLVLSELDDEDAARIIELWNDFRDNARSWMRIGYRRAFRRFGDTSDELPYVFKSIADSVENFHGSYGDELVVQVYPKETRANVIFKPAYELDN